MTHIPSDRLLDEVHELTLACLGGEADGGQVERLNALLSGDEAARRVYANVIRDSIFLHRWATAEDLRAGEIFPTDDSEAAVLPPSIADVSPLGYHGAAGYFSQVGPLSYLIATVILGVMLLSAWTYQITHYRQLAITPKSRSADRPETAFVGRVTGMKDCRWSDPQTQTYTGASVPLGRKYALASGLMEITYLSGTKVILEGPCTYEIESDIGGFLSLGKLTALVEKRGRVGDGETGRKPRSPLLPSSPSPRLFSVRTPTAVVTDLGTEFGVEVNDDGNTTSHVFRGSVRVEVEGDESVVLRENESVRIEKISRVRETHQAQAASGSVRFTHPTSPPKFVRRIHQPPKYIDLLDIVAGGNGTGNRRERGIDPTTGLDDPVFFAQSRTGNHRYWPVARNKMIDGVFAPDGRDGAVQVDSAGHVFDGFPETRGVAWGSIWSRAADVKKDERSDDPAYWVYALDNGGKLMPERRGLLCVASNEGITFDLAAVRRVHSGVVPERFRATAGMADLSRIHPRAADGMVDIWVIVDGRLKQKREKLRLADGAIKLDVELAPSDRFLTLAVTDAGNDYAWDWFVFGDPLLDMKPTEENK